MSRKLHIITFCIVFLFSVTTLISACAFSHNNTLSEKNNKAIVIEALDGITPETVKEIEQIVTVTQKHFAEKTDMALETAVTIVLTPTRKAYIGEVISRFNLSELEAERVAKGTDALSGNHLIIVNNSGIPTIRQKTFLLVHEITHFYQRQIAGPQAGTVKWLLEGIADKIGAQIVSEQGYFTMAEYKNNWQNGLGLATHKPKLSELITSDGWSTSLSQYGSPLTYKTAGCAVLFLTEQIEEKKVFSYFTRLKKGESPESAFQNTFGMSMSDFMSHYENLIRKAS